jgi:DNA-binding transcriptional ArsR family regulator
MLRERPHTARELMCATGLGRSGVYGLLERLSETGGVSLTNYDGYWYLLQPEELAGLRSLYRKLRDSLNKTPRHNLILASGAIRRHEAAILVAHLRRTIVPPEPD